MEMRDHTQDSLGSKSTRDKHSINTGLRFSKKVQGAIIALIVISIASVTMMGCITNSSKPSNSVSDPNRLYSPLEMTDDSVASALNNSSFFVLDFYYPGCGPCKIMNNTTSQLSNELQGQIGFGRMNVRERENSQTVKKYKVSSYPTLLLFDEGVLVNRMKGNTSKSDLLAELKDLKPGLDTSKVMLQTDAAPSSGDIALAKLGEAKPTEPMLITDSNIDSAVKKYPYLVIDGFTTWCEHCKPSNVTLEQLSSELQGQVAFGLINIDKNRATKVKYNITSYPTLLIFKDGELAEKRIGTPPKSILVSELKKHYPDLNTSKVNLTQPRSTAQAQAAAKPKLTPEQVCINMTKSDQPLLQAFVVARCPFGLQMQRIMAEIVSKSPQAKDYLKVRYIGSVSNKTITSMHGDEEAQENLRQICIREEQPDKYWDYVSCYMIEGKSAGCLNSSSLDKGKLSACVEDSSRGLTYAQKDFDLANKFNVTGSPTLTLNNEIVSEFDFATNTTSARSPEAIKELLCCGFDEEPSFCTKQLKKAQVTTMFQVKEKAASAQPQQNAGKAIPLIKVGTKNPDQAMMITDATLDSAISQYQPLLVVVGYTDSCGYCKLFNVTISELARELQGQAAFGMIDAQKNNDAEAKYNMTAIPITLIFKDGKLSGSVIGNKNKSTIVAKLKGIEPMLNTSKVNIVKAAAKPKAPS